MRSKKSYKQARKRRVRAKISGTHDCPRLSVFRSLSGIYAQLIDDEKGITLASASSKEVLSKGKKTEVASEVGKIIAKKALDAGMKKVVFDRGGNKYHGRIKGLADSAREAGLKF